MINVGLIGCGIIGSAMKSWLEKNSQDVSIYVSDPDKGYHDDVMNPSMDAYFIQVNVLNRPDGTQDCENIANICASIRSCNSSAPIWIRSTITPTTFDTLDSEYTVNYMPEFLTERTAFEDFERLPVIYTTPERKKDMRLLKAIMSDKSGIEMTNIEAIFAKYAHNVFGAMKVTFFNCLKELCEKRNADYEKVLCGALLPGHISRNYTSVPGPDGKCGYGGKCFPKDTVAFLRENRFTSMGALLEQLPIINKDFRKDSNESSASGWQWFSR